MHSLGLGSLLAAQCSVVCSVVYMEIAPSYLLFAVRYTTTLRSGLQIDFNDMYGCVCTGLLRCQAHSGRL